MISKEKGHRRGIFEAAPFFLFGFLFLFRFIKEKAAGGWKESESRRKWVSTESSYKKKIPFPFLTKVILPHFNTTNMMILFIGFRFFVGIGSFADFLCFLFSFLFFLPFCGLLFVFSFIFAFFIFCFWKNSERKGKWKRREAVFCLFFLWFVLILFRNRFSLMFCFFKKEEKEERMPDWDKGFCFVCKKKEKERKEQRKRVKQKKKKTAVAFLVLFSVVEVKEKKTKVYFFFFGKFRKNKRLLFSKLEKWKRESWKSYTCYANPNINLAKNLKYYMKIRPKK